MVTRNTDNHETAFTVSIDHVDTTTGISAAERSLTAMKCVDPEAKPEDFRRPGHMFPLLAKDNGVLERNGHTEATVDLMRLAGLKEVGLCCEIMREDGTMMRAPELQEKSKEWGLKFITIRDLQNYRKRHEVLVDRVTVTKMPTKYGDFMAYGYVNKLNGQHHVALVKGTLGTGRICSAGSTPSASPGTPSAPSRCDCGQQLAAAMTQIEQEGRGILLYMRQEGRGAGPASARWAPAPPRSGWGGTGEASQAKGPPGTCGSTTSAPRFSGTWGPRPSACSPTTPDKVYQLADFGMAIKERVPIQMAATPPTSSTSRPSRKRWGTSSTTKFQTPQSIRIKETYCHENL